MSFARVILAVSKYFMEETKLNELLALKEAHPNLGSSTRGFEQAIEKTRANIKWAKKNLEEIEKWLDAFNQKQKP